MSLRFGPSKFYYLLMLAALAASYLSLRLFFDRRMEQITADLARVAVPGAVTVELDRPGVHVVYLEHQGTLGNQLFMTGEELGDLECSVSESAGKKLSLSPPLWKYRYGDRSRAGLAVLEFRAVRSGPHILKAHYPPGTAGPELLLAVGEGLLGDLSLPIVGGLALALAPGVIGLGTGVVIWRARKKARRRLYGSRA